MKNKKKIKVVSLVSAVIVLWFIGVDKSLFVEQCDDCLYGRDIIQYRIFTIKIHESVIEHPTIIQLIAKDLGTPCPHSNSNYYHKYRWWGLTSYANPRIPGTTWLDDELSLYTEEIAAKVRQMSIEDPNIKIEFFNKAILGRDVEYRNAFISELFHSTDGKNKSVIPLG